MAEAPYLSREIAGKPLEGRLPAAQPTVCCLPPGWVAQTGCPGKDCSTAVCPQAGARGAPNCGKRADRGSCWRPVRGVPSPLGTDPGYLL